MSGVAGFFSKKKNIISENDLKKMQSFLVHRGNDSNGIFYSENCGLVHQRLATIDLSISAQQPMLSNSLRYIGVIDGAVYNFREIADDLNIKLNTKSDIEVVLEAFAKWGIGFVNKLNGTFAIAIYDKKENLLYIFRDRFGAKSLYYYLDDNFMAFGSEIKTLLSLDKIKDKTKIEKSAIQLFLHLGYVPEPKTIYQNIQKFPVASFAIISETGTKIEPYWTIESIIASSAISDFNIAKERTQTLLENAVKLRIDTCDVDWGVLLSGGTDSSLITAIANKYKKTKKINTFAIALKNSKNTANYARQISEYLGTNHYEFEIGRQELSEVFENYFSYCDEVFLDHSIFKTLIISEKVKKEGFSSVIAGYGGNELFFGHKAYTMANYLKHLYNVPFFTKTISKILKLSKSNKSKKMSEMYNYDKTRINKSHIFSQTNGFFSITELQNILTNGVKDEEMIFYSEFDNFRRKLSPEEEQAIFDFRYFFKDDLLAMVDKTSMINALEVRMPLLDYNLVEFSLNIDSKFKIFKKNNKFILKQILNEYIPENYYSKGLRTFVPIQTWLQTDKYFSDLLNRYLNKDIISKYDVVKYSEIEKIINNFKGGESYLYNRIWLLIILHKFLSERNFDFYEA